MMTKFQLGVAVLLIASVQSLTAQTPAVPVPKSGNSSLLPPLPMPPRLGEGAAEEIKPPKEVSPDLPPIMPLGPPMIMGDVMPSCSTCGNTSGKCTDPGCDGTQIKGPKDPVWISFTQLLLWFQPSRSPFPLATGVAGQTLLDGQSELGMYKAFQVDGGMWLDKEHTLGVGMGLLISEHRSAFQTVGSGPGGVTIRRPYTDAVTGAPTSVLVSNADGANGITPFAGSIATAVTARIASADIGLRRNIINSEHYRLNLLFGFRYFDLDESLTVYQTSMPTTAIPAAGPRNMIPAGSTIQLMDRSYTRNQFYGGELGGQFEYHHGLFFVGVSPRLAFGPTHQITQISGQTQITGPAPQTLQGGLLAAGENGDGNLNRFVTNRFTVMTQVGAEVGVQITKHLRTSIGYQFLYLNDAARPGAQLSQTINPRVIPISSAYGSLSGPRAPNVTFDREGFYAHGAAIKVMLTY